MTGNDELSRLAEAFNRMLASLASSRERQKQLIADAGHELRTPLTSLRTNIELLQADARTGMLRPEDRSEILRDVSAQLAEFTTLIGDLVQLARDERVAAAPEPIDFRDVVNAALDRVRLRGPGLTFDVELNPFYVVGESDTLERAVTNLLDNAVKWSPPGGVVRVQLEGDRLRVADQGPGINEADLPYIFDRFYRADTARNTPGTGLGLSIVASTVERHGGWVKASRSAQGGAEFTLHLPGSTTLEGLTSEPPSRIGATASARRRRPTVGERRQRSAGHDFRPSEQPCATAAAAASRAAGESQRLEARSEREPTAAQDRPRVAYGVWVGRVIRGPRRGRPEPVENSSIWTRNRWPR